MSEEITLIPSSIDEVVSQSNEIPQGVKMVNAPTIWNNHEEKGKDVVVAVLDTGCDPNHQDLKDRIVGGRNFTSDYNGDPNNFNDNQYHGTHVAGTIAGTIDNNGVAGVSPEVKLLIGKVLTGGGSGTYQGIIDGINWAVNWRGENGERVRVISMSLGGPSSSPALHQAIKNAVAQGVLVICAAGNEGDGNHNTIERAYPGMYPEVIQVGAVDFNGKPANFTNSNNEIDIVAPGVGILSTYPGNKYARLSGTSMATPHVSGVAALLINLLERDFGRELTESEIYAQLCKHTRTLNLDKKFEGNGLVDLDLYKAPPKEEPKEPVETKTYSVLVKPQGDGHVVQLGFYHNPDNAKNLAKTLQEDLLKIEGNQVNVTHLKLVRDDD